MIENTKALDNPDNAPYEENVSELENGRILFRLFLFLNFYRYFYICV